jgi:hypothetical protein
MRVRPARPAILALLPVLLHAWAAPPCAFFVSPTGNDTSPGTQAAPCQTLERAAAALRAVPRPLQSPAVACLRGGRYAERVSLGPSDSGSSLEAYAGFVAYPGEAPEIVGSVPVAFSPLPRGDPAWAHLPPGAGSRVLVASLPAAGLPNASAWGTWVPQGGFHGCSGPPLELLLGPRAGQTPRRAAGAARGPPPCPPIAPRPTASRRGSMQASSAGATRRRCGFTAIFGGTGVRFFYGRDCSSSTRSHSRPPPPRPKNPPPPPPHSDYYLPSAGWDSATGEVRVAAPLPSGNLSGAARYYAFNSLSALDAEGEWHLNRTSGSLYWLPPAGADARAASVSLLPTLVDGTGVANFLLGGLTFWGSRGSAVDFSEAANVTVLNCTVLHAGLHGISVSGGGGGGGGGSLVQGNAVSGTGGRGVSLISSAPRAQLAPTGDRVADNTVHDFERVCLTYAFGLTAEGPGVVAERNEVFNSGHACATIQGNNALFRWNVLHHCVRFFCARKNCQQRALRPSLTRIARTLKF